LSKIDGWTVGDGNTIGNTSTTGDGLIAGGSASNTIYETPTSPAFPLGYRLEFSDGRAFRYSHFVAAIGPGKLAAQDVSVSGFGSIDGKFTDSGGTAKDDYGTGDKVIYLKDSDTFSTADAADVYAGGYMQITDAAGEGYNYKVRSNDLGTSDNIMKIELFDNLAAALDSESSCSVVGYTYKNLAINNHNVDAVVAGVTSGNPAAADYGWVQTWGVANILADESAGTIGLGTIAQVSDNVDGAAQPFGGGAVNSEDDHLYDTSPIIGFFCTIAADGEYVPIYLQIAP